MWVKRINTCECLTQCTMSFAILTPNIGHGEKKKAASTCDWLTRLVISGQAKERRKQKKNYGKDEEGS